MDTFLSHYTHNGVKYVHDGYTGKTMRYDEWSAAYDRNFTPPKKPSKAELAKLEARQKAQEKVRKVRQATRDELMQKAEALAKKMPDCTQEEIDQWRIDRGYFWKVVSPKGTVYTETLKAITVKDEEDFVVYQAMKIACARAMSR